MNATVPETSTAPGPVPIGDAAVRVGRSSISTLRLLHPTISRSHAVIERQGSGVIVRDLDSRYGSFVNGVRIGTKTLAKDDLIRFGTSISYRFTGEALAFEPVAAGYRLTVRNVTIVKDGRTLVSGASFDLPANAFVGILGPSGSGKSTLLSVLASYHQPVGGEVLFDDGQPVKDHLDEYRACLGNVPQEDIVYSGLTGRENLLYSARLRSSADIPDAILNDQVTRTLTQVGLLPHADTPFERLSGGQKKRVSVALELLKRPRLLLLDEPTSGLDPAAEANLMEQLKVIASQGTTVACTTHQMDNVGLFNLLIVIGCEHVPWQKEPVGRVAYVGEPGSILSHFGCRGFADAFEHLGNGAFTPAEGPSTNADVAPPAVNTHRSTAAKLSELMEKPLPDGVLRQAKAVAERNWKRMVRDRSLVATMLAQPVVLGLLVAVTQFAALNTTLLNFFACVVSIWMGLNNSARDLVRERKNYVRERLAGLSPDGYLLAKLCTFSLIGIAQIAILLLVTYVAGAAFISDDSVPNDFAFGRQGYGLLHCFGVLCCLILAYMCGLGLGLLASTLARSEEAAVAALPLLIMPQILISAVAVGCSDEGFNKERAFKPLVMSLTDGLPPKGVVGRLLDDISMLCYSRPASLVLDIRNGPTAWIGDLMHLLILLILTWVAVYIAFRLNEEKWPKLLRLG
jgi:ABC-type cobalamin/Fe3+-siderophores transport system ATPase subunit